MQKVIDAHVHILNDSLFHLKWLEGEPSLEKNSSLEDYHNAWKGQDRYEVKNVKMHILSVLQKTLKQLLMELPFILT